MQTGKDCFVGGAGVRVTDDAVEATQAVGQDSEGSRSPQRQIFSSLLVSLILWVDSIVHPVYGLCHRGENANRFGI